MTETTSDQPPESSTSLGVFEKLFIAGWILLSGGAYVQFGIGWALIFGGAVLLLTALLQSLLSDIQFAILEMLEAQAGRKEK